MLFKPHHCPECLNRYFQIQNLEERLSNAKSAFDRMLNQCEEANLDRDKLFLEIKAANSIIKNIYDSICEDGWIELHKTDKALADVIKYVEENL